MDAEELGVGNSQELGVRDVEELGMRWGPIWRTSDACEGVGFIRTGGPWGRPKGLTSHGHISAAARLCENPIDTTGIDQRGSSCTRIPKEPTADVGIKRALPARYPP